MKSIYVWWDSNFGKQFQENLLNALYKIIELGEDLSDHFNVRVTSNFFFGKGMYENADWYFHSSLILEGNK